MQQEEAKRSGPSWTLPPLDEELDEMLSKPVVADEDETLANRVVPATIEEWGDDRILLTLEDGTRAWCPRSETKRTSKELRPGDTTKVLVEYLDEGYWKVAIDKVPLIEEFARWEQILRDGETVEAEIHHVTRGGFAVEALGVRGFMPGRESGISRQNAGAAIGRTCTCEVLRFDLEEGQPILSRRRLARGEAKERFDAFVADLKEGALLRGRVVRIMPFGAFIEIAEDVEGLLHISEMTSEHVESAADVVREGEEIDVNVISVDAERRRIGLSRRRMLAEEEREVIEGLEPGTIVDGTVMRIVDFGAFIAIAPGVEGLCHISELSWTERVKHPSEMLAEGDEVRVMILDTDASAQRVSLSLRKTESNPWAEVAERFPAGSKAEGEITRIEDYGLFIKLADGIEGLCHISDLTWEGRPERPSEVGEFAVGDSIEIRVLDVDTDRQRIRLGLKQLGEDPWEAIADKLVEGGTIEGRVVRFDENAAYVEVSEHVEGRIHISQISTERVESIRAALRINEEITTMITKVDRGRRRLDLSIRALREAEEANAPRSHEDNAGALGSMAEAFQRSREEEPEASADEKTADEDGERKE